MTRYEQFLEHLRVNQYTWLITGVAGFIGSNLLEALLTLNQKVIGLDNFETGYQCNIDQAIEDAIAKNPLIEKGRNGLGVKDFHFIKGDIRNLDDCRRAMKWPANFQGLSSNVDKVVDFVLHQAALGSVPRSVVDPIRTNEANIDGFLNMLVAARDAKVKRFVYAASSSTYGDHPDLPKIEDKIGKPLSPYAVTKVVNEQYAQVFARTYSFSAIGLRYFNIFGKRQDPNGAYAAVIPKWIDGVVNGEEVFINGDGQTSRDFCYIENVIQVNILAAMAEKAAAANQVYNVAVGERTSLNDLYKKIRGLLAEHYDLGVDNLKYHDFRVGDVRHSQADISKAQNIIGYRVSHRIDEGLKELIEWYMLSHDK